jgi:hypothetical protein
VQNLPSNRARTATAIKEFASQVLLCDHWSGLDRVHGPGRVRPAVAFHGARRINRWGGPSVRAAIPAAVVINLERRPARDSPLSPPRLLKNIRPIGSGGERGAVEEKDACKEQLGGVTRVSRPGTSWPHFGIPRWRETPTIPWCLVLACAVRTLAASFFPRPKGYLADPVYIPFGNASVLALSSPSFQLPPMVLAQARSPSRRITVLTHVLESITVLNNNDQSIQLM